MKTYEINKTKISGSKLRRLISENPELIEKKEEEKKSFYTGDWTGDWDGNSKKYYIYIKYNTSKEKWNINPGFSFATPQNDLPIFGSEENAEKFINDNRQNIFDYFGIEIRDEI